jgi:hypothetical protein
MAHRRREPDLFDGESGIADHVGCDQPAGGAV